MRAALLVLAGCIDIHDFRGGPDAGPVGDGGGSDAPLACTDTSPGSDLGWDVGPLGILETSGEVGVSGVGWELHFSASMMHFPYSYSVGSTQLLATATNCKDASLTGVSIVPGGRSDAGNVGTSNLIKLADGPDIVSYQLVWSAQVACVSATITSTWTMFPDGRITRFDQMTTPSQLGGTCLCAQSSPNGFSVVAETLYASNAISTVTQENGTTISQSASADAAIPAAVCLTGNLGAMMVSLAGPGSAGKLYSNKNSTDIALGYHFFDASVLAPAAGTSSWVPVPINSTCSDATQALAGFTQGVALALDGAVVPLLHARDGVAGELATGIDVHDTATFTVKTGVPAPPGYAIGLHFLDGVRTHVAVTRNGAPLGIDKARVQPIDNRHAVLWLRDSFGGANAACDEIHVVATP